MERKPHEDLGFVLRKMKKKARRRRKSQIPDRRSEEADSVDPILQRKMNLLIQSNPLGMPLRKKQRRVMLASHDLPPARAMLLRSPYPGRPEVVFFPYPAGLMI